MLKSIIYSSLFHLCLVLGGVAYWKAKPNQPLSRITPDRVFSILQSSSNLALKDSSTKRTAKHQTPRTKPSDRRQARAKSDPSPSLSETHSTSDLEGPSVSPNHSLLLNIRSKILENLHYPGSLRRRGIEGQVQLRLILNIKGKIQSLEIDKSSGYEELDLLALRAVTEAEPFNLYEGEDAPKEKGRLKINLPIEFKIN